MNNQNQNLGEQFKTAVGDAINKGDFSKLNFLVTDTVTDVIAEASCQIQSVADEVQKGFQHTTNETVYQNAERFRQEQNQRNERLQAHREASQQRQAARNQRIRPQANKLLPISKTKNVGEFSSILYIIVGGIGVLGTATSLIPSIIFSALGFSWPPFIYILLLCLLLVFLLLIKKGLNRRARLTRMKQYVALCDDNMYVNIKFLAERTGKSISYVLKDVKKMLQLGFFPEGHLDTKETCLMLDHATYQEYVRIETERKTLAIEEAQKRKKWANSTTEEKEVRAMLEEGEKYIQKLHQLNELIPDEVISEKLYRMENLLREIFERVQETPEQRSKMQKLMSYYLPTTIKLLQAYADFDDVSAPGQDIISAKAEIEKTIDIINDAFVELLNKLFQTSVYDITADAQVLQTMLAKEGLTKNKFSEETK